MLASEVYKHIHKGSQVLNFDLLNAIYMGKNKDLSDSDKGKILKL